jgi:REP element-mobilizing transposase RayT
VINRGNFRQELFVERGAAEAFERALGEAAVRFAWRVHAYVVMSNHFHLAIELTEPNLSVGMQWLQGTWARRVNLFRKLTGRSFQGRFKALVVEPGAVFTGVCDYIHLNPVRAGIVEAERVTGYPWSSLPKWSLPERPGWLDPRTALGERGGLPDDASGWQRYTEALILAAAKVAHAPGARRGAMSRGWCLGSAGFRTAMKQRMEQKGMDLETVRLVGLEADEARREREAAWESRLFALAAKARIALDSLPARKSDPSKTLLAAAMKHSASASNGWLAARLAMGPPASASQFVRRRMLSPEGAEEVRQLLSNVKL